MRASVAITDAVSSERIHALAAIIGGLNRRNSAPQPVVVFSHLRVKGKRAMLNIGDFETETALAALGRDENVVTLAFAHCELSVRNFRMTSTSKVARQSNP